MAGKSRKRTRSKGSSQLQETKKQKVGSTREEQKNKDFDDSHTKLKFEVMLKEALNVELPDDFFYFFDFCKALNPSKEKDALLEVLNLELCGPYDILVGKLPFKESQNDNKKGEKCKLDGDDDGGDDENDDDDLTYHMHSRFYYDPPEFMTLIRESPNKNGFHIGYFRDDPNEAPAFLASNCADIDCIFLPCGDNIFAAVNDYAQKLLKSTKDKSRKERIQKIINELKKAAEDCNERLEMTTSKIKARKSKVVTNAFHKAGVVVPIDSNEVGYRPLNISDNALKKLLDKICAAKDEKEKNKHFDELHDLVTLVQFANDECDYGMGLELGIDLFSYGNEIFKGTVLQLLPLAYSLLGRKLYGKIIEKHLEKRVKMINEI